jgi:hypothetical protein
MRREGEKESEQLRSGVTLSRSNEIVSLIRIRGLASPSKRRKKRVIASCLADVVVAAPLTRPSRCEDRDIRIGRVHTGSGALPISESRRSMTEEATIGAVERTRLQSIPAAVPTAFFGGGGTCKGLYAFCWRHVVSFVGSDSLVTSFRGVHEIHQ